MNERYLITGATGYIGSMLVEYLCGLNKKITALVRDRGKAEQMLPADVDMIAVDLTDRAETERLDITCDHIIHCAAVTKSAEMVTHPVEVIQSLVNVTQNVCELARRCNVKGMVYLSSMEVYGDIRTQAGHRVTEEEVSRGAVNILNVRSCYPLGKRMAENICHSYFKEYGLQVKIARVAQTFGKGILPGENRVFAQFARAVIEKCDIVLHTSGNSMGNYCGIDDAVKGILTILESGAGGEAYNVVNEENTMTIRQMAEFVAAEIAGGQIRVTCEIPEDNRYGYAADTGLRLSGQKLMALGWRPKQGLSDMYRELLADIKKHIT